MNKKIMIIDDEFEIVDILKEFLSRNKNISVSTSSNPENAISLMKEDSYDLLMLDIMMPMVNGLEILEQIKLIQPNIKVVMMTAYPTKDKKVKSDKFGADAFLEKPFDNLKMVKLTVERLLGI